MEALETDPALVDIGDAWMPAFKRPRRELGVLRAATTALAGGYAADAIKLVVRVVGLAREAPERFPDRGSIRWCVERGKLDPGYLLRPSTLDRLIPEAEARPAEPAPEPAATGPIIGPSRDEMEQALAEGRKWW